MSNIIPRAFIDDLLARVDIVDLINSHVPLKKTGSNFVARCPFHNEKSPSFSVSRSKQFYHCFGCGAGGNAVSFLMSYNNLEFIEAIEDLAAFAGVSVPRETSNPATANTDHLTALYTLLQQVAEYYAAQLRNNPEGKQAVAYLKQRGINSAIASDFMLGYAPGQWQNLEQHFDKQLLVNAGLIINKDDGGSYDRFRERITFPIRDKRGRTIGFGARVFDDSKPKYLNSPETATFQKGKEVYGLYELLNKNSKPKRIMLVEGYMDVIALAQAGISYAVAALGTATSKTHLDLLFRYTPELVLCFDGDEAGRKAAWRAMEAVFESLREGRQVRIMPLPPSHDPDSLIRADGLEAFNQRIEQAQGLSDYFFEQLTNEHPLTNIESKAQVAARAQPYLNRLADGIYKQMMQNKLLELVGNIQHQTHPTHATRPHHSTLTPPTNNRPTPVRTAIALLLQHPQLIEILEQQKIDWELINLPGMDVLHQIAEHITEHAPAHTAALIESFRDTKEYPLLVKLVTLENHSSPEKLPDVFRDTLANLSKRACDNFLDSLLQSKQPEHTSLFSKLSSHRQFDKLTTEERELLKKIVSN